MMSRTALLVSVVATALVGTSALVAACSNAVTPDAYYDYEVPDAGHVTVGNRDQPCIEVLDNNGDVAGHRCNSELVCVNENSVYTCRAECDEAAADPCGTNEQTCRRLSGDNALHVCLPAYGVDEPCPCQEGLVCTDTDEGNRCKYECFFGADGGVSDCPVGECRRFTGSDTDGACIGGAAATDGGT